MKDELPYFGDKDAIEAALETIDETLISGRFPNKKKVSDENRQELLQEKIQLKKIIDKP